MLRNAESRGDITRGQEQSMAPDYLENALGIKATEPPKEKYTFALGIDVSHYQGAIEWDKVAAWKDRYGNMIDFAYVKATDGSAVDDYFKRKDTTTGYEVGNWAQLEKTTIYRGAYHFFYPWVDVDKQVKAFCNAIKPPRPDVLLCNKCST